MEDFESREACQAAIDAARLAASNRTLGEAVRDYLQEKAGERGAATIRYRLLGLLRLREGDRALTAVNAAMARRLYQKRTTEVADDTHIGELQYAVRFFEWCIGKGWVRLNPFADVAVTGERRDRRDQQLRVTESRAFFDRAMAEGSLESHVVLMALMMGLRAHEVVERVVRDVDDDGRILWVPKSKTKAGVRQLRVPQLLRTPLLAYCAGKGPGEALFIRDGHRPNATRHWLHYHVVRLAKEAGVPRVTPHGLRRTWFTLKMLGSGDALSEIVREGGHADRGDTARRHYLAPGAEESAGNAAVESVLVTRAEFGVTKQLSQEVKS